MFEDWEALIDARHAVRTAVALTRNLQREWRDSTLRLIAAYLGLGRPVFSDTP